MKKLVHGAVTLLFFVITFLHWGGDSNSSNYCLENETNVVYYLQTNMLHSSHLLYQLRLLIRLV